MKLAASAGSFSDPCASNAVRPLIAVVFIARLALWVQVASCIWINCCLASTSPVASAEKPNPQERFLVISPKLFHSELNSFITHKAKSWRVELVALETILAREQGTDDPEKLKRFLYREWRENGLGYVLLVGDIDVMPVRFMVLDRITPAAFDYAFYPSDLYYSDLAKADGSFESWNAQTNGFHALYFGEVRGEKNKGDAINYDEVDYRPEIALGRWPVSTAKEVGVLVAKSMRGAGPTASAPSGEMANAPAGGSASDMATSSFSRNSNLAAAGDGRGPEKDQRRVAFIAVGGWVDTRARLDGLAEKLTPDWVIEKRYYKDAKLDPNTPAPNYREVTALFNQGMDLVVHTGHGQPGEWEQCLSYKDLARLTNTGKLPVAFSAGCSTATFAPMPPYQPYVDVNSQEHKGTDHGEVFTGPPPPPAPYQKGKFNPTGLGEQLLKRGLAGAEAYIGCNTGSQPCAITLLEGFVTAGANGEQRLGDCWNEAIRFYYQRERLDRLVPTKSWYPASIFFQGMKFMLFGDPTLDHPR